MTNYNLFRENDKCAPTEEEKAEIERLSETFRDLQRQNAVDEIRQLARRIMALSRSLSDEKTVGRILSESDEGDASTVQHYAEQIHCRLTAPRDSATS
ncbi:hypothetical protein AB6V29_14535 [Microbacterium sp. 20-116]|uniref:hypothetical protein n=1 Tax=Microbacterium sp. 20-116 TaxID=3239883 RepID=UPI0034E2FE14